MPTVSVCIPAYNHAQYLSKTIESVLQQTYADFELILIDDCSTDETPKLVRSIKDPRFHYLRNQKNLGSTLNWNKCLQAAKGKYVSLLPADDWWKKRCVERFVTVLDRHPRVGLAFASFYAFDMKQNESHLRQRFPQDRLFKGEEFFAMNVMDNRVATPAVMVRQECYQRLGYLDPYFRIVGDWELWLRIALHYDVAYIAQALGHWRYHGQNASIMDVTEDNLFDEELKALRKVFYSIPTGKEHLKTLYKKARLSSACRIYGYALGHLGQGHMRLFRKQSWQAVKMDPRIVFQRPLLVTMGFSYMGLSTITVLRKIKNKLRNFYVFP